MSQRMGAGVVHRFCSWSRAPSRVKRQQSSATPCKRQNKAYTTPSRGAPDTATPLEKLICDSIKATGPLSVSEYTQLCLSHPTEGYYMKQRNDGTDVFGAQGDFITSPEISQVFGEVGIWLLSQWLNPTTSTPRMPKIRLVELGPGRGTLMDDILRTFSNWPQAKAALSTVHLVETSDALSGQQKAKLTHWFDNMRDITLHTYGSIEDVPPGFDDEFTMVIAHEFFDALPAHILEKTADGFREVLVDLNHLQANSSRVIKYSTAMPTSSSPFRFVVSSTATPRSNLLGSLSPRFVQLPPGSRLEVSSAGWRTARKMGELISRTMADEGEGDPNPNPNPKSEGEGPRGAGLIIDYGDDRAFDSSFRAFKNHRIVDVFDTPGLCDLTTNVDFALLKEALQGAAMTHGPLPQSEFLLRMGIRERLAALVKQAPNEERRLEINRAGRRLIDRAGQGMGAVYRVLGITSLQPKDGPKDQTWPFIDESQSRQ